MWSLFAPLGKPSRFSSILCNHWKYATRRQWSHLTRPWTAEEERKLRSLVQQGFGTTRIASEMSDRPFPTIENRLMRLKAGGKPPRIGDERRGVCRFTAEENALMLEKRRQGLSHRDIASYFPNRSLPSVSMRFLRLLDRPASTNRRKNFTEEELQRIIEMRWKEGKTFGEISDEMQCSPRTVSIVCNRRCPSMGPEKARRFIYLNNLWTPQEQEHLVGLQRQGTISVVDAARQFPSRTLTAVRKKIMRMRLTFPRLSKSKGTK